MHRKFIATVTAASLALTALGSTSVAAENYNTERALAALLGLAVVGAIVHENRKDKKERVNTHRPVQQVKPQRNRPPVYGQINPRPLPKRAGRKLLPQKCLRSVETRNGRARFFGQRCLNNNYDFAHRLPRACNYTFRTNRGERRGYEARCLRDRGFRLARR